MPAIDTGCLYSTIRNSSGATKKFGFLPPHGRELTSNEEFTIWGSVLESLIRFERVTDRRHIQSFEAAIERGDITILETPSPVLLDATTGNSKILKLDNEILFQADPCYSSLSSSDSLGTPE